METKEGAEVREMRGMGWELGLAREELDFVVSCKKPESLGPFHVRTNMRHLCKGKFC